MPGIFRIEVPLPGNPLKSINSYVITGKERNLVIDTGMNRRECLEKIREGFQEIGLDLNRTDFFITHLHADHTGLVLELKSGSSRIYFNGPDARVVNSYDHWGSVLDFALSHGFPSDELNEALQKHPGYRYSPKGRVQFDILEEGDIITIGEYNFKCISTPGHTDGHLCLYEPERFLFFSGDHILGDITSNISMWREETNPLKDYISSLDKVNNLKVELVLPGHRSVFKNFYGRIKELKEHHLNRLNEVLKILQDGPMTAYEVASRMAWDIDIKKWTDFPVTQKWFAHGEAIAHLRFLEGNLVERIVKSDGIIRFSLKDKQKFLEKLSILL